MRYALANTGTYSSLAPNGLLLEYAGIIIERAVTVKEMPAMS